jgi:hypothetical protein
MKLLQFAAAGIAALLATAMPGHASAATVQRDYISHGPANCQPQSVSDASLVMRTTGIYNIGNSSSFVTCDFDITDLNGLGFKSIEIVFVNNFGSGQVRCTLIDGSMFSGYKSITKSLWPLDPGLPTPLGWTTADNDGKNFEFPAVQCLLPPKYLMFNVEVVLEEDVGE